MRGPLRATGRDPLGRAHRFTGRSPRRQSDEPRRLSHRHGFMDEPCACSSSSSWTSRFIRH